MAPTDARARVLLLDDNWDAAMTLAVLLRNDGYVVRTTHTADEAVTLAEQFLPHAIILDIWLPTSSGYDAARRIRKSEWGADTVLIAATGWGHDAARRRSEEAGFDHHLVKPIDIAQLRRILSAVDAQRKPAE